MDYLAQAQKEIELAQTMVQNGIYPNIDDALKEIRKKKAENDSPNVNSTPEQMPKEAKISEAENTDSQYAMAKRVAKLEQVLQDFGKFFVDYKTGMESNMKNLQKDFLALQSNFMDLKNNRPSMAQMQEKAAEVNNANQTAASTQSTPKPEEKKEPYNERQGTVTSADVKIEDFFSNAGGKMDNIMKK